MKKSGTENLLTFHVEKLYDDDVWRHFSAVLKMMDSFGIKSTCFVYPPLHPIHTHSAGFAKGGETRFRDRLKRIQELGHEIQQHTHLYTSSPTKANEFTRDNCLRAIGGEKEYLEKIGYCINGFVSGAFNINMIISEALKEMQFHYDCSVTLFYHAYANEKLSGVSGLINLECGLVELPTTHTTKMMIIGKNPVQIVNYKMVYAHDYDFVRLDYQLGIRWLLIRNREKNWKTASEYLAANPVVVSAKDIGVF
jgi:hypothetical protein